MNLKPTAAVKSFTKEVFPFRTVCIGRIVAQISLDTSLRKYPYFIHMVPLLFPTYIHTGQRKAQKKTRDFWKIVD